MKWLTIRHYPLPHDREVIVRRDDLPDYQAQILLSEKLRHKCEAHVRLYHVTEDLVKDVPLLSLTHWKDIY